VWISTLGPRISLWFDGNTEISCSNPGETCRADNSIPRRTRVHHSPAQHSSGRKLPTRCREDLVCCVTSLNTTLGGSAFAHLDNSPIWTFGGGWPIAARRQLRHRCGGRSGAFDRCSPRSPSTSRYISGEKRSSAGTKNTPHMIMVAVVFIPITSEPDVSSLALLIGVN